MTENYLIFCLSETLSILTHMSKTEGNEGVIAREPVNTANGIRWIPTISGNQIRHKLLRSTANRFLINFLGLKNNITLEQLNFLFHGGDLKESSTGEDTKRIVEAWHYFPILKLLGSSFRDQMLPGATCVSFATLVCEENRERINALLPSSWKNIESELRPAESFVTRFQYTRGEAAKDLDLFEDTPIGVGGKTNLMITAGQAVLPRSLFIHDFYIKQANKKDLGAFFLALRLWATGGIDLESENLNLGTLGGQSGKGHGRLKTEIYAEPFINPQGCVDSYLDFLRENKEAIVDFFYKAFETKAAKAKK